MMTDLPIVFRNSNLYQCKRIKNQIHWIIHSVFFSMKMAHDLSWTFGKKILLGNFKRIQGHCQFIFVCRLKRETFAQQQQQKKQIKT